MLIAALSIACFAAGAAGCEFQDHMAGLLRADQVAAHDSALVATADGYVTWLYQQSPFGTGTVLSMSSATGARTKILLRWAGPTVAQAVGQDSLVSARIELTIAEVADGWGSAGRLVELHRMTHDWVEARATYRCSDDTIPSNTVLDCTAANNWMMSQAALTPPWVATPTATTVIHAGQTGIVTFDVTADVRALLQGGTDYGWLLKKQDDETGGQVGFGSRESPSKPRLVLSLVGADTSKPAIPSNIAFVDDSNFVVGDPSEPAAIYYRRLADIVFQPSTSGATIRAFMAKYQAAVVAGLPGSRGYTIQFADPGSSWGALDTLIRGMNAEPGVRWVVRLTRREPRLPPRGRFPADGPSLTRASWFDASSAYRWGFRAIRAPLAWGCETGDYGGAPVRVAVLDNAFDTTARDIAPSYGGLFKAVLQSSVVPTQATIDDAERHGLAMSAMLTATGGNDSSTLGVMWRSDLRLYSIAIHASSETQNRRRAFLEEIVPRLILDQPRVLSISIPIGPGPADTSAHRSFVDGIKRLLDESPGTLVVVATGNDPINLTSNQVLSHQSWSLGLDAALIRLKRDSGYGDRILFVAGTMRGNQLWRRGLEGTTYYTSVTELAAPAESIPVADLPRLGGAIRFMNGTSLSAPMVAGVAGLLWSYDPSLTPEQVKSYLVSPLTVGSDGIAVQRQTIAVPGGGSVYQLDAYSALALRAQANSNLPVCGYPVRVGDDFVSVRLDALVPAARTLPVPGSLGVFGLSVAQGGRRIAVHDYDAIGIQRTTIMTHTGTVLNTYPGELWSYLERDTVIARRHATLGYPLYTLRGPTLAAQPNSELIVPDLFAPLAAPGQRFYSAEGFVAPSADYVLLATRIQHAIVFPDGTCSEPDSLRWYLVQVNGTGRTLVRTDVADGCANSGPLSVSYSGADWSHDGQRATFAVLTSLAGSSTNSTIQVVAPSTSLASQIYPGFRIMAPVYAANDSLVEWSQADATGTSCSWQWRNSLSPFGPVGAPRTFTPPPCPFRRRANAPPAFTATPAPRRDGAQVQPAQRPSWWTARVVKAN